MPAIDVSNPNIIKFLVESYDKTTRLRMKWTLTYGEKLKETAQFSGKEKGYSQADVAKSLLVAGMVATRRENINTAANRRTKPPPYKVLCIGDLRKDYTLPKLGLGDPKDDPRLERPDDDLSLDPIMRPVPLKQKEILYGSEPRRKEYLKVRNRMKPEDKYYLQESKGWETGWRLKDSYFSRTAPKYPRQGQLHKALISRCGAKPDPVHYIVADVIGLKKQCVAL